MWFRLVLACGSVGLAALTVWLATHVSEDPRILGRYSPAYFGVIAGVAILTGISLLAQTSIVYRRLHAARGEIVLVLSSCLVTVLALEVAMRVFDPLGLSHIHEGSRYQLDKIADPALVYRHAPNLERTYQRVRVSTNDMGLRERPLTAKEPDELRILLLGDSVTFGWGVPVEDTFGRRLESLLSARLRRPVRTVNAGVGSYNTVQQDAFLTANAGLIEPDIVLLQYNVNDIEVHDAPFDPWSPASLARQSPPEAMFRLIRKSWLYRLGAFFVITHGANRPTRLDHDDRGLRDSMAALAHMAQLCRARGMGFIVFFYRWKAQSNFDALVAEVRAVGHRHGFPVIDVRTWWGDLDKRAVTNSVVDAHPNARGHEILAVGVAAALIETGPASAGTLSWSGGRTH